MAATRLGAVPSPTLFATFASTFDFFAVDPMTAFDGLPGLLFFFATLLLDGIALRVYQIAFNRLDLGNGGI
jgi:hypothetical protein